MLNRISYRRLFRASLAHSLIGGGLLVALAVTALPLALIAFASSSYAQTETIIHEFKCSDFNGCMPAGLIASEGVFYGIAQGGFNARPPFGFGGNGTIFAMIPPRTTGGSWGKTVLYRFLGGADGAEPEGLVPAGANHILYGTTNKGGTADKGTFFSLQPAPKGGKQWIKSVLYSFVGPDEEPGGLVADSKGVLYGVGLRGSICTIFGRDFGCGTVFSLTPPTTPGGAWTERTLYYFTQGSGGYSPSNLIVGSNDTLYGVAYGGTNGDGLVFSLTPSSALDGPWTENILYAFNGQSDGLSPTGLVVDHSSGKIFGMCYSPTYFNPARIFELTPPATPDGAWTERTVAILNGDGSFAGGLIAANGLFYGWTTFGGPSLGGTLVQLTPSATPPWTVKLLHSFQEFVTTNDGAGLSSLVLGPSGSLYGTTSRGGFYMGGTFFEITP